MTKYYVFYNKDMPKKVALTVDKSGSKLPGGSQPWVYQKSFSDPMEGRIGFGLEDQKLADADIEKHGYHIYPYKRLLKER